MTVLLVEREGPVVRLTLNRPAAGNAIDLELATMIGEAAREYADDPAVRCVVLTGAGRTFCVGGDIADFVAKGGGDDAFLRRPADTVHQAVLCLATMPKPLLVLVNGPAAGAGLALAVLGDVVLAGASASFTAAYLNLGLTPDGGMSWLLPRLVGLRRTQEIILTNRRIRSDEAAAMGLVTRTVPDGQLAREGADVAASLASAPTEALGAARTLLRGSFAATLEAHLDLEASTITAAGASHEGKEGVAAFLGKRTPDFRKS